MKGSAGWFIGFAALSATLSGCVLFAAGAGAGGAIYLTSRGAESTLAAAPDEVLAAAEQAFRELNIRETSREIVAEDARRELRGESEDGDLDVSVEIERDEANETTRVKVTARDSPVTWDKEFARSVLERIVRHVSS